MKYKLDVLTELSPLEFASKIASAIRGAIKGTRQSLGAELEFDIFFVLDGREVRFLMKLV